MATNDDDWEDTSQVEVPLAAPGAARKLQSVAAGSQPLPKTQSASARAAFAAIRTLGVKFDEHAKADQDALKSIDGKISTMHLEHVKSNASMQLEIAKASTNVDRLIATVEMSAAARLRVATEAETAAIQDGKNKRAAWRDLGVTALKWVGGPLVGAAIAAMLATGRC